MSDDPFGLDVDQGAGAYALPRDWTAEDNAQLNQDVALDAWEARDPALSGPGVKYWPDWTDPSFDPDVEINFDGSQQRAALYSGLARRLRPAILPEDYAGLSGPSEFAKRWGIHEERTRNARNQSRSKMTPIGLTFGMSPEDLGWTEDESYQAYVLSGFTTQEVI